MSLPFHSMIKLCNTASQLFVFSHFVGGGGGGGVLCRWSWSRLCLLTYLLNKQHKTTTTTSVVSFCITAICVCLLSLQYHWVTWLFFFNVPIYSSLLISLKKLWVNIFFSLNEMGKTGAKIISKKLTKGSSVIFRSFFKSVFPKNLLGLPPPPSPWLSYKKKSLMGIPMYTCTSMYLNTHTSFMQDHSSTPLPFTTTTSLTTPHCAMFIELFLLEHLRCFFVIDDQQRRFFCREQRPWQSCTAGGGRTSHAFTPISVTAQGFFSLAARLARDERLWVDTTWMRELSELVVEDNHSSSNRSLWRWTLGRLVCRVEGVQRTFLRARSVSSASFHFCCGHWYHYWRTFNFFLAWK